MEDIELMLRVKARDRALAEEFAQEVFLPGRAIQVVAVPDRVAPGVELAAGPAA
jgi:hypothetical protein